MNTIQTRAGLTISSRLIYDELVAQQIPVSIVGTKSNLLEYTDVHQVKHLLVNSCSDKSSATGKVIADSKTKTSRIATLLGISIPASIICHSIDEAREFLNQHARIVIKPSRGYGGSGISTNITTGEDLQRSYKYAKSFDSRIIAQEHIIGEDVRLLVVDGHFCSAVMRRPASITGDGTATIEELIDIANESASRNDSLHSSLTHIKLSAAQRYLGKSILTIPLAGRLVAVAGPANVSLGGSVHEATQLVTRSMIDDSEAITQKLGLGICGVDMMWNQKTNKHYLIEVNAMPGLDLHNDKFSGISSDSVQKYVQWLIA